ncbi:Opaque10 [Thalictrum thalictroides]|uniref:Opaque10 n=1 Tax=Thalictrum thalictroides TaxID=46969 RepID=A0A7J6WQA1_THATH|nr:Opaque10 [Thalictrum thalictroides]
MRRVVARADSTGLHKLEIDSFPFSAESNFREHDHMFLQNQTRIWLGEMLKTRLDEDTSIADLLADGLLLFEVSKVIWKLLLTKFMKLRSSKAYFSKSASGKKGGRYMPYSNVDSFLKICQVLGLTGIDLFSPSDVVEKRDIRRVCMCIRSLSKKARSKDLNVPDFDVVTYTVTMSKDMVKGIRNSLEQSQCEFSEDSPVCSTYLGARPKYGKKNWGPDFARHYDSYSEESDNSESNYQVGGFHSPASTTSRSCASLSYSDLESSPGGSFMAMEDFHLTQCMLLTDGRVDCSPPDAEGSLSAYHQLNDSHRFTDTMLTGRLFPSCDDPMEINAGTNGNKEAAKRTLNTSEDAFIRVSNVTMELEACASLARNSLDWYKSKQDVIGRLSTSEINNCATDIDESSLFSSRGKIVGIDRPLDTDELQIHSNLKEVGSAKECQLTIRSNETKDPEASEFLIPHDDLQVSGSSIINQQCLDGNGLKSAHQACMNHEDASNSTEYLDKNIRCEQVGSDVGASDQKRNRKSLWKSFAGGMSLFGVLILIFHVRRPNSREKTNETSVLPVQIRKTSYREMSTINGEQRNRTSGVYPAEKLRF